MERGVTSCLCGGKRETGRGDEERSGGSMLHTSSLRTRDR